MPRPEDWTPEQRALLIKLWPDPNITGKEIARRLGVSKNAAAGKAFRMGLTKSKTPKASRAKVPKTPKPQGCAWPLTGPDSPQGVHYCGSKNVQGQKFCDHHCRVVFVYYPNKKEDAE